MSDNKESKQNAANQPGKDKVPAGKKGKDGLLEDELVNEILFIEFIE